MESPTIIVVKGIRGAGGVRERSTGGLVVLAFFAADLFTADFIN